MLRLLAGSLLLSLVALLAGLVGDSRPALAATLTVNSTADTGDFSTADGVCDTNDSVGDGPCTLRAAIEQANASAGTDTIAFNVPGAGPHTIQPASALPTITGPVVIDGTTQPGFAGVPIVELDGTAASAAGGPAGARGVVITAGSSTVRALVINRFTGPQRAGLRLSTAGGNVVEGNFIGTDVSGTTALGNEFGVEIAFNSPNNRIGGTAAGAGNVISGNQLGIEIQGPSTGNTVEGNFIGTNLTGTAALGNTAVGVSIFGSNNTIGGTSAAARNVISGNPTGIRISFGSNNVVEGNLIGTDVTGSVGLGGSTSTGIEINLSALNNLVGGTAAGTRNVISGNLDGVIIRAGSKSNRIEGNYIGTNLIGSAVVGNGRYGIWIDGGVSNAIGGTATGAGNVIAGQGQAGILASRAASGNTIQANLIGTDATGTVDLGNSVGVALDEQATLNMIGGTSPTARNLISANLIGVLSVNSSRNTVQGNFIGTDVTGTAPLGNSSQGVLLLVNSFDYVIGGPAPGAGNVIAFNGAQGVLVATGTGNAILRNSIFSNGQLGIDLNPGGVTPNDTGDPDTGPNSLQNFPVLTSASSSGGSTTVNGTMNSTPNTTFRLEFFSNTLCDPSQFGEGETFLGFANVTTDGSGNASFTASVGGAPAGQQFFTSTGTDPANNTSEFSNCVSGAGTATSTPTATATPTRTATPTATHTSTATNTPTSTPTATATIGVVVEPTATPPPLGGSGVYPEIGGGATAGDIADRAHSRAPLQGASAGAAVVLAGAAAWAARRRSVNGYRTD